MIALCVADRVVEGKRVEVLRVKDGDRIWDLTPPYPSFRNRRQLKGRSLIIGFVGPRGAGKSVGAAIMTIWDYMLAGYNVWSNMDIGFHLVEESGVKEYHSNPLDDINLTNLDEIFQDGLLLVDEINMEFSEARRSMSNKNLMFSYILQQLRKRRLNLIWTAQSEMHVDDRLRFQSDFIIMTKDLSTVPGVHCGVGELSRWRVYDTSGLYSGQIGETLEEMLAWEWNVLNKPWWNSFDTWQLQGICRKRAVADLKEAENFGDPVEMAWNVINHAKKNHIPEMPAENIWDMLGITTNFGMQSSIGRYFGKVGIKRTRHGRKGRYYYAFPI